MDDADADNNLPLRNLSNARTMRMDLMDYFTFIGRREATGASGNFPLPTSCWDWQISLKA
ncbi:hypothetical protein [Moraxella atlantae]|uniref:hypothetical protein n=1 Tax=Faucicola atlantae TaxID=34059 RepID=UPI0011C04F9F|nr:hypothetical protein [Moraxella atlantae]